jgi:ABC-2 type transport system permease protein
MDPVVHGAIAVVAEQLVRELNAEVIKSAAVQGFARLTAAGAQAPNIPPEVVAHPFKGAIVDRAPVKPQMLTFFAPAVLALVLQHLALTLTALSMVRERLSGAIDMFRVAPVGTLELLVGKYVAYALLSALVTAAITATTTGTLGIPFRGQVADFAAAAALVTFASLGLGLLISLVSDSERQAVQVSMLVLLFTVFFSGFVLSVEEFRMPVRALAYVLPATYGIELFQDEMLRGSFRQTWMLGALALIGATLFALSAIRLRSVLRPAY